MICVFKNVKIEKIWSWSSIRSSYRRFIIKHTVFHYCKNIYIQAITSPLPYPSVGWYERLSHLHLTAPYIQDARLFGFPPSSPIFDLLLNLFFLRKKGKIRQVFATKFVVTAVGKSFEKSFFFWSQSFVAWLHCTLWWVCVTIKFTINIKTEISSCEDALIKV